MKSFLFLSLISLTLVSCSSVDSIKKSTDCIVWKDQKYLGPYSIEVIAKKVDWKGACKGYNRGCYLVAISLDENNNVLSGTDILGKIENNELKFAEKHVFSNLINFSGARAYPDQKLVRSSIVMNGVISEESYSFNDKCSNEEALTGVVALTLIGKVQSGEIK